MTDAHGQQIAPGWYPDPAGGGGQRWWDGIGWTEHLAPAAAPAASAAPAVPGAPSPAPYQGYGVPVHRVPDGTPTSTVWVWLVVFLPIIPLVMLFFWDVRGYLEASVASPYAASTAIFFDPWYLTLMILGWIVYGLSVWFSYLDYAALAKLGYVRRFHWAWTFLSALVYVIGRSVFVRREAGGRGMAPMWAVIAVNVASFVVAMIWTAWLMTQIFEFVRSMPMTSY
ncbi:DUF2510 domain-containing protein [Agromyces mediolanus]|uniref:DUF2510 domain-containing protein n=1 Tax=Agromyces mediolanus TaxID=41986 RepID=UPI0038377027